MHAGYSRLTKPLSYAPVCVVWCVCVCEGVCGGVCGEGVGVQAVWFVRVCDSCVCGVLCVCVCVSVLHVYITQHSILYKSRSLVMHDRYFVLSSV